MSVGFIQRILGCICTSFCLLICKLKSFNLLIGCLAVYHHRCQLRRHIAELPLKVLIGRVKLNLGLKGGLLIFHDAYLRCQRAGLRHSSIQLSAYGRQFIISILFSSVQLISRLCQLCLSLFNFVHPCVYLRFGLGKRTVGLI